MMEIFTVIAGLIFAIFILYIVVPLLFGAPFLPSDAKTFERTAILLGSLGKGAGKKAVDLGSGDGRMVIELAKLGYEAHGYEINPLLVWQSRHK